MKTRTELLLTQLTEECLEIGQRVCKAERFGLEEIQYEQPFRNDARISLEVADLIGVFEMLVTEGILPPISQFQIDAKKLKVEKWIKYSLDQQQKQKALYDHC